MLEALLIESMQHCVPGAVGGGAGTFGEAFAPVHGMAAERPLVDRALFRA